MKKHLIILLAVALAVSCTKDALRTTDAPCEHGEEFIGGEIPVAFSTGTSDVNISETKTRTSVVTTLQSFNVVCRKYTTSTGWVTLWSAVATKNGDVYETGKTWPASIPSGTKYKFYCSNLEYSSGLTVDNSFNADGGYYIANTDTDWVYGESAEITSAATIPVTLSHLLARIGTVTVSVPAGYTITVDNAEVYFFTDYKSTTESSENSTSETLFADGTRDEGIWCAIGQDCIIGGKTFNNVAFLLEYNITKGNFSKDYVRYVPVQLVAGRRNNVVFNAEFDAVEDGFNSHVFTLDGTQVYIANTDLCFDGTEVSAFRWHLQSYPWSDCGLSDTSTGLSSSDKIDRFYWASSGYNGHNPWLDTEGWSRVGPDLSIYPASLSYGDTYGSNTAVWTLDSNNWDWGRYNSIHSHGNIPLNGTLRVPTIDEFLKLADASRMNSFPVAYVFATVNGKEGLVFFSDDYVHPSGAPSLVTLNHGTSAVNVISTAQWKLMQDAGAVALLKQCYWPSNQYDDTQAWAFEDAGIEGTYWKSQRFGVRLIKEK